MISKKTQLTPKKIRQRRVRAKVVGTASRPRLSVFRSNRFIYASIIDDSTAKTIVSVSDAKEPVAKTKTKDGFNKVNRAKQVGQKVAELALAKGIKSVVFDRAGYRYTGRVASVAIGAREAGLEF